MTEVQRSPTLSLRLPAVHAPKRQSLIDFKTQQQLPFISHDESILANYLALETAALHSLTKAEHKVTDLEKKLTLAQKARQDAAARVEKYSTLRMCLEAKIEEERQQRLRGRALAVLPDEILVLIGTMCLDEERREFWSVAKTRKLSHSFPNLRWIYPITLSHVCLRWRITFVNAGRLWAFRDSYLSAMTSLFDMVQSRAALCTLDCKVVMDPNSDSLPFQPQHPLMMEHTRYRSLAVAVQVPSVPINPTSNGLTWSSLRSLELYADPQLQRPPSFNAIQCLPRIPNLTHLSVENVHLILRSRTTPQSTPFSSGGNLAGHEPGEYRHNKPMTLIIKYYGIISFRARDMNDIAALFPQLKSFTLCIRGPYSGAARDDGLAPDSKMALAELENLEISAKDLGFSLGGLLRAAGKTFSVPESPVSVTGLGKLKCLRLLDMGSVHGVELLRKVTDNNSNVVKLSLQTVDYECPGALSALWTLSSSLRSIGVELSTKGVEFLGAALGAVGISKIRRLGKVERIELERRVGDDGALIPIGAEEESAALRKLMEIVKERNRAILKPGKFVSSKESTTSQSESPLKAKPDERRGRMHRQRPATTEDRTDVAPPLPPKDSVPGQALTQLPPPPPPKNSHGRSLSRSASLPPAVESSGSSRQRSHTLVPPLPDFAQRLRQAAIRLNNNEIQPEAEGEMVPIILVDYEPWTEKGRMALEEVYGEIVKARKVIARRKRKDKEKGKGRET